MAAPHWKSDPRHGDLRRDRTQIAQAAQRLLIAEARPRLQMGEVRRGLRPLSRHDLPRAILLFLVGGALSEIDSEDETRGLLRQFVVPSLEWAVGGAQQIARRGSARKTAR